jgi:hypothetical protein
MSTDIVIHHVELSVGPGDQPIYVVSVEEPRFEGGPGEIGLRVEVMPTDIFETRAAEYAIDMPTSDGWDQVLDLVFGGSTAPNSMDDPGHLYNAATIADARKARLEAVRAGAKGRRVQGVPGLTETKGLLGDARGVQDSGAEDPVEFIKRTAPMSAEHIKVKQEFTRRRRNLIRARKAGRRLTELGDLAEIDEQVRSDMNLPPPRETAGELARRLLGELPPEWTGYNQSEEEARRSAAYRDENDILRNRMPPRLSSPSKSL